MTYKSGFMLKAIANTFDGVNGLASSKGPRSNLKMLESCNSVISSRSTSKS